MKDNKLEVGDVLYEYSRWHGLVKHVVDRLTPTTAISGSEKYKIELLRQDKIAAKLIGEYGHHYLETEKLKEQYLLQETRRYADRLVKKIDVHKLTKQQLDSLIKFIKPLAELVPVQL